MLHNLKSFNLPEIEEKVLQLWKEKDIFKKTLKPKTKGHRGEFNFWEGPPSANGRPGIHHVLSRVIKDVFLRYKTMQGYVVARKAGWDTHGLPVEIETEKTLGFKTKREIEEYGIKEFNQKAQEVVWKYKDEWEKITERIGFWLDMKDPYITCDPKFMESLWWVFRELDTKGYLKELYKVAPYCPRCQTALANHELGQPGVYRTVSDPSVFIQFPLKGRKNEYLLVWTTTPWTLSANVAVAVSPSLTYTKYQIGEQFVWAYQIPEAALNGKTAQKIETIKGSKMIGWEYDPLYKLSSDVHLPIQTHTVLAADFISTEDGTGLVHIAPSFGEDDFNLVLGSFADEHVSKDAFVLPHTVNADGTVAQGSVGAGLFVKDADKSVVADLEERGLLFHFAKAEHEYPFCWRCATPLLYMARKSWFFEVSRIRKQFVEANKGVNWVPDYIKEGRFGEWIAQAKDWAISRERYWGTPLPIWKCESCAHTQVIGSVEELAQRAQSTNTFYVLRHGEATGNVKNICASGPERGSHISKLTKKGIESVKESAQKLRKEKIDLIYASPFQRTRETAQIVAKTLGLEIIEDARLVELDCGVYNWKPVPEYHKFFSSDAQRYTVAPEGAETLRDVRVRMLAFLRDIDKKHAGKRILIVSHGDPLWMLATGVAHMNFSDSLKKFKYIKNAEFRKLPFDGAPTDEEGMIDLHRPYVDDVTMACPVCGKIARRVPDVADVWFDSGSMPYAQAHYPFKEKQQKGRKKNAPHNFPADFISEGIDQTRGWFYTLMAVSVMLGNGSPYKNVVSLGLVLDKYGQKMSKSKGNVVDPWYVIQKFGVDAVRWYFYTVNSPADSKNFDEEEIGKTFRRFLMVAYNSFVFLQLYGKDKLRLDEVPASKHPLDAWIVMRLLALTQEMQKKMDGYDVVAATSLIETFLDDLSRWYIRRSRRRLQKPDSKEDWIAASATLAYVLLQFSKIIAPFTPFFAEALYQSLKRSYSFSAKDSVHMELVPHLSLKSDKALVQTMQWVRDAASMALAKRAELGIKVRQALASISLKGNRPRGSFVPELLEVLKDEINVKEVIFKKDLAEDFVLDTAITPELRAEGVVREFVRSAQELRQKANYVPKDRVQMWIVAEGEIAALLQHHEPLLKKELGAVSVTFAQHEKFDAESELKIDGKRVWLALKKI